MIEPVVLLVAALVGALLGCATGLLPGLHVNTLAVVLVATAPAWDALAVGLGIEPTFAPFAVAALILAITVSHTFVNIVPATFLGAPDEQTALTILPAHKFLRQGRGFRAVQINAYGSFFALVASLLLFWPAKWLLVGPVDAWNHVREAMPWLLVLLAVFLVWREPACLGPEAWPRAYRCALARLTALALFLATGLYGLFGFRLSYQALVPLPPSPLLPMLSGLFGAATLIEALAESTKIPHQFVRLGSDDLTRRGAAASLGCGVAAGAGMSLFPGLTNSTATAVATAMRRGTDAETLLSLGAVNTANAIFNLLVLYLFDRARSGSVVAIEALVPLEPWQGTMPVSLVWMLFVALAAGTLSLAATLALGRWAARGIHAVPYRPLVWSVLVYLVAIVVLFSGWTGALVFAVGASLGSVPVRLGLQRSPLTGVLLVPVLGYLWV